MCQQMRKSLRRQTLIVYLTRDTQKIQSSDWPKWLCIMTLHGFPRQFATLRCLTFWHVLSIHQQGCQRTWKVREIWYFFKVREWSGNFENWSVKNKNPQKSGKSQGKIMLKGIFFSITSIVYISLLALNISLTSILLWLFFIIVK